jgi:hypothetical protein
MNTLQLSEEMQDNQAQDGGTKTHEDGTSLDDLYPVADDDETDGAAKRGNWERNGQGAIAAKVWCGCLWQQTAHGGKMGENISILNKRNEFLHSADFKLFSQ